MVVLRYVSRFRSRDIFLVVLHDGSGLSFRRHVQAAGKSLCCSFALASCVLDRGSSEEPERNKINAFFLIPQLCAHGEPACSVQFIYDVCVTASFKVSVKLQTHLPPFRSLHLNPRTCDKTTNETRYFIIIVILLL